MCPVLRGTCEKGDRGMQTPARCYFKYLEPETKAISTFASSSFKHRIQDIDNCLYLSTKHRIHNTSHQIQTHVVIISNICSGQSDVNTFSYSSTAKISFVCLTIVVVLLIVVFAHYKNPAKTGFVWQIAGKQLAPTNVFIGRVLSCPWVFLIWLIFQVEKKKTLAVVAFWDMDWTRKFHILSQLTYMQLLVQFKSSCPLFILLMVFLSCFCTHRKHPLGWNVN